MRARVPSERGSNLEDKLIPRKIRDGLGISRERMARLLDVSTRTVERWEDRDEPPARRVGRERLAKLQQIVDLGLVVYGREWLRQFLTLPMPTFGGRTALQM